MIAKNAKTILFASLIATMILPFSGIQLSEAKKESDMTDYVSQYEEILAKIWDNKESIEEDSKKLKDKSKLSSADIIKIEKRIKDKKAENDRLWKKAAEVEKLNIESYILNEETQAIFDNALEILTGNYLNKNGVYDVFPDNKYRKMIVMVDPDDFETSSYAGNRDAFITELENSADVDVETIFEKMVLTNSTWHFHHTLKEILEDRQVGEPLTCPNPEHVLVLRPNSNWACVYFETAKHLSWDTVLYSEYDAPQVTTSVFYDVDYHHITYQTNEGIVDSVEIYSDAGYVIEDYVLNVSLTPTKEEGNVVVTLPSIESNMFKDYCIEFNGIADSHYFFYLVDGMEVEEYEEISKTPSFTTVKLPYESDSELVEIVVACLI